MEKLEKALL